MNSVKLIEYYFISNEHFLNYYSFLPSSFCSVPHSCEVFIAHAICLMIKSHCWLMVPYVRGYWLCPMIYVSEHGERMKVILFDRLWMTNEWWCCKDVAVAHTISCMIDLLSLCLNTKRRGDSVYCHEAIMFIINSYDDI